MLKIIKENFLKKRIIRRAIDTYPDGICFAQIGGRPILVNKAMNSVCFALTGHTVTNSDEMWEMLRQKESDAENTETTENSIICRLSDGAVWQFRRTEISLKGKPITQYEASDVSELFEYQTMLRESIRRETELHARQRLLLNNIVQNNLDKEFLDAKVRIHDSFGQLLLMTKAAIKDKPSQSEAEPVFLAWDEAVSNLKNASMKSDAGINSPQEELTRVAEMIGCKLDFRGEQPAERKALLLLYAAVREALTNAVKHAGADRVTVIISNYDKYYAVEIRNNGSPADNPIQEKGGLLSLRKRLEQEGATLNYAYDGAVSLLLTIPKE